MCPNSTSRDCIDCRWSDIEDSCPIQLGTFFGCDTSTQLNNLSFGKTCLRVIATACNATRCCLAFVPSFACHVFHVVFLRSLKEMKEVAACWSVTVVKYQQAVINASVTKLVRNAISLVVAAVVFENSITRIVKQSFPKPAFVTSTLYSNSGPELGNVLRSHFGQWAIWGSHLNKFNNFIGGVSIWCYTLTFHQITVLRFSSSVVEGRRGG